MHLCSSFVWLVFRFRFFPFSWHVSSVCSFFLAVSLVYSVVRNFRSLWNFIICVFFVWIFFLLLFSLCYSVWLSVRWFCVLYWTHHALFILYSFRIIFLFFFLFCRMLSVWNTFHFIFHFFTFCCCCCLDHLAEQHVTISTVIIVCNSLRFSLESRLNQFSFLAYI